MDNLPPEIKILALLTIGFLVTVLAWKIRSVWRGRKYDLYDSRQ